MRSISRLARVFPGVLSPRNLAPGGLRLTVRGAIVCDYSLYAIRQRLASEGDQLVTYRFETGSIGFAALSEVQQRAAYSQTPRNLIGRVLDWLRLGTTSCVTAVCMPPGARIELDTTSIPLKHRSDLGLQLRCEATFDEISAESFMYRDALRLDDGRMLLLQSLPDGIRGTVLSLGASANVAEEAILINRRTVELEEIRTPVASARRW